MVRFAVLYLLPFKVECLRFFHGLKMRGNFVELKGTTDVKLLCYFCIQKRLLVLRLKTTLKWKS